jgi:hypothetical protein
MKRVWGYNHLEPESLGVRRCKNTDCDHLLNDVKQAMIVVSLTAAPPDGGLWNSRKVADWMSELNGEKVCRLHRVGISQVPEVSIEISSSRTPGIRYLQNLRNGKKNRRRFVLKIQKENPESDVEVWSMDEHRIGLKPVLRPE